MTNPLLAAMPGQLATDVISQPFEYSAGGYDNPVSVLPDKAGLDGRRGDHVEWVYKRDHDRSLAPR